jgi:hypothetical protein
MPLYTIAILSLLTACAACALSLTVALRVKKLLDPLIEEGTFSADRPETVAVGTVIPKYANLRDLNGNIVASGESSSEPWILAFLSTTCSGCKAQLPIYRDYLLRQGVTPDRIVTVISGESADLDQYAAAIGELSQIVHADETVTMGTDLRVSVWPMFAVISSERSVEFSTTSVSNLPELLTLQATR